MPSITKSKGSPNLTRLEAREADMSDSTRIISRIYDRLFGLEQDNKVLKAKIVILEERNKDLNERVGLLEALEKVEESEELKKETLISVKENTKDEPWYLGKRARG